MSNQYCTIERFVEAYCDLHIYKIGARYRAIMSVENIKCPTTNIEQLFIRRKSLTGNWKTNIGEVDIEEVPVQDKYKKWIDEVSSLFGGLELCSLEAIVDASGKEYIIEVNDCAMGLLGDGQDEDRRLIAEIVINSMEVGLRS